VLAQQYRDQIGFGDGGIDACRAAFENAVQLGLQARAAGAANDPIGEAGLDGLAMVCDCGDLPFGHVLQSAMQRGAMRNEPPVQPKRGVAEAAQWVRALFMTATAARYARRSA